MRIQKVVVSIDNQAQELLYDTIAATLRKRGLDKYIGIGLEDELMKDFESIGIVIVGDIQETD